MAARGSTTMDQTDAAGMPTKPVCRCEATIPASILEGYACGNPACWRTPIVQASFDAFVSDLVRARDADG